MSGNISLHQLWCQFATYHVDGFLEFGAEIPKLVEVLVNPQGPCHAGIVFDQRMKTVVVLLYSTAWLLYLHALPSSRHPVNIRSVPVGLLLWKT
jgi:hypothetical protein